MTRSLVAMRAEESSTGPSDVSAAAHFYSILVRVASSTACWPGRPATSGSIVARHLTDRLRWRWNNATLRAFNLEATGSADKSNETGN
jgi:hypothetical protein